MPKMTTMLVCTKKVDASIKTILRDFETMIDSVIEDKFDIRKDIKILASYMDMNECDSCIYFECTKRIKRLWITDAAFTLRFDIIQYLSIFDLSLPVNFHKYAGQILFFSKEFDENENLKFIKNVFKKAFKSIENVPAERIMGFFVYDDIICIRNYLIEGAKEIGPRLSISLDKAFTGCFQGPKIGETAQNNEIEQN